MTLLECQARSPPETIPRAHQHSSSRSKDPAQHPPPCSAGGGLGMEELPRGNELCVEHRNEAHSAEQMVLICTAAWHRRAPGGGGWGGGSSCARTLSHKLARGATGAMHHHQRDKAPGPDRVALTSRRRPAPGSRRIGFSAPPPSRRSLPRAASAPHCIKSGVQGGIRCGQPSYLTLTPPLGTQVTPGGADGQRCLGPCVLRPRGTPYVQALLPLGSLLISPGPLAVSPLQLRAVAPS